MTALERYGHDVAVIGESSFCPSHYRDKQGVARWADLAYAVETLRRLEVDPVRNIDQTYVVGGKVSFMAELQRALCRRAGFDLEVDDASDDKAAMVRIRRVGEETWHHVTVTMTQAITAKWPERNPSYGLMPERMLVARACTRAISLYAPEASRLIGLSEAESPSQIGGLHTVRRDEPAVPNTTVARLRERIEALPPAERETLYRTCKALRFPNLEGPAFTIRDAALLRRLIDEVPDEMHDGAPEAAGGEDQQPLSYDRDDPTRPFTDET